MNGSFADIGARLRSAVQLVDATTGAQLWAEPMSVRLVPKWSSNAGRTSFPASFLRSPTCTESCRAA